MTVVVVWVVGDVEYMTVVVVWVVGDMVFWRGWRRVRSIEYVVSACSSSSVDG